MQRYFIDEALTSDTATITLTGDDARHISRVMRMREDDALTCCDIKGVVAHCHITDMTEQAVNVAIDEYVDEQHELPVHVGLAQGLPKGDKLDLTVQKGTEYGVETFFPFTADRSIVKWDDKKKAKRTQRLCKIAKEAAEQAFRNQIPTVETPMRFSEMLAAGAAYDIIIAPYEAEATGDGLQRLRDILSQLSAGMSVLIVIGPEGGFSDREVGQLREHHCQTCGLGPRILRTETAALYLLSILSYELEAPQG